MAADRDPSAAEVQEDAEHARLRAEALREPVTADVRRELAEDEYDEDPCGGTGVVECWNPGGPCPAPNDPECETCGPCFTCAIDQDPT